MLVAIAAMSNNRVIGGPDGHIPWAGLMPADVAHFRALTLNHTVIMGHTTFSEFAQPLSDRLSVVLTRHRLPNEVDTNKVHYVESVEAALTYDKSDEEVFVIGGAQVFTLLMPSIKKVYLTVVDTEIPDSQVIFPDLPTSEWKKTDEQRFGADEQNRYDYRFEIYERR